MMETIGIEVLQASVGAIAKSRNSKKKVQTTFGKIIVPRSHILQNGYSKISMSSYAQDLCCFVGQQAVFEEASGLLKVLNGVDINAKQIERICHIYGRKIEAIEEERIPACRQAGRIKR